MKRLLIAIACCAASPVWADAVLYKCIDGKGAVSITSVPCPAGSKQAWKRDTAAPPPSSSVTGPMPPSPPTPLRNPPVRPAAPAPAPPPPTPEVPPAPPVEPTAPASDPCDHAKDVAAQLRDMPWLELSHDQEQRLLGWVVEQCRH